MQFKKIVFAGIIALVVSTGLFAATDFNTDRGATGTAFGIFLGQPTGLTLRVGLGGGQSFEAKAAWDLRSYGDSPSLTFQANWLLEFRRALVAGDTQFPLYIGAGLESDVGSDQANLGFRIPFGIVYRFREAPLELNLEFAAGMRLFPDTAFNASGGLGLRYRFR